MAEKNGFKLVSALTRGYWGIDSAYVHGNFQTVRAILNGSYAMAGGDPDEDVILDTVEDDIPEQQLDSFTGKIAVMSVSGPLMHYGGECSYGSKDYAARLMAYADDPSIAAGIMVVDGPGGQVEGTQTFEDAVLYFTSKKPLIGFVDDGMAASAHFWVISACTEIYCSHETCEVGSVGVLAMIMDARKAMEEHGLKEILIYAPQSSDKNKDIADAMDGNTAAVEESLKFIASTFIGRVEINREGKLTSSEWNSGKMFYALEAQKIGLIDGVKSFEEVVKRTSFLIGQHSTASQNQQNNMGIFGSDFPVLNALREVKDGAITAEQVTAVNAELVAKGVTNLVMIGRDHLTEANLNADAVSGALAIVNTALGAGKQATLSAAVTALVSDRDAQFNRAEAYGEKPGEKPTNPESKEKVEGGDQLDAKPAATFMTSFDAEVAENNKKLKIN